MTTKQDIADAGTLCRGLKIDGVEQLAFLLASIRATLATEDTNGRLRGLDFTLKQSLHELRQIEYRKLTRRTRKPVDINPEDEAISLNGF